MQEWRAAGYPVADFPTISEILAYQIDPATAAPHFLRRPQRRALETYWYLRLVSQTPHSFELYQRLFPAPDELCAALGLTDAAIHADLDARGPDALWQRIKTDTEFVRAHNLEALHETLTLAYPSYILALAMGAGKTLLIGAIIATEFALALDYPAGPFVQNALLFAPGKTILTALRQLADIPFARIVPPRLFRTFAASVKLTFTRDGDRELPIIRGSYFNIVVTNTEKIRIRTETIRKRDLGGRVAPPAADALKATVANLRLQTLASLPNLAVFSDEAHHTYGRAMGRELKRVRQTVDYLHQHSPNLRCVVNTTGTPYFARQPLRDVVIWYGLAEGIADGILKEVDGSIQAYQFDAANADQFIAAVVTDFFYDYADVSLPDGAPAKLAIYFPQTSDLEELRPVVETSLAAIGQPPTVILTNTSHAPQPAIDAFNRLNDPASPHRVILLVNKGTEGWNCPSLFACALARKLTSSNNFVLQAATRCLRQVPGNRVKARIYLSRDNLAILERQLRETYGTTIADLDQARCTSRPAAAPQPPAPPALPPRISPPPRQPDRAAAPLRLTRPVTPAATLARTNFTLALGAATGSILQPAGDTTTFTPTADTLDLYTASVRLATNYRLELWEVYDELRRIYPEGACPAGHLEDLARQIEAWMG